MPLSSFCGLLTLQVGASILAAVFLTLASVIIVSNIFDFDKNSEGNWPVSIILVIVFAVSLFVTGLLAFNSSYTESRAIALATLIIILLLLIYWIVLCCFSFISSLGYVNTVCIRNRCPESFWLAHLDYRTKNDSSKNSTKSHEKREIKSVYKTESEFDEVTTCSSHFGFNKYISNIKFIPHSDKENNRPMEFNKSVTYKTIKPKHIYKINLKNETKGFDPKILNRTKLGLESLVHLLRSTKAGDNFDGKPAQLDFVNKNSTDKKGGEKDKDTESQYKVGAPFFAAIVLFILNLLFLIYSAASMWSWAQELDWADYYIEDPYYDYMGPGYYEYY